MAFSDPQKNIESFGLSVGTSVADLGAGTGFYTMAAARAVGEGGRVYAVDIQADLLARIKAQAHQAHLNMIEVVHGDIEKIGGTRLRDGSVDAALVCNVMFQLENKEEFVQEVKRIVKPGGRVLVINWTDSFGGMGPQENKIIHADEVNELFTQAGFSFVANMSAGDHHYGLIFRNG